MIVHVFLTAGFLRAVQQLGCPSALVQHIRKILSSHPTRGRKIVGVYDDPNRLPGGGYYENIFPHGEHKFATLHLYGDQHRDAYLIDMQVLRDGVVEFRSSKCHDDLQKIAQTIYGVPKDLEA